MPNHMPSGGAHVRRTTRETVPQRAKSGRAHPARIRTPRPGCRDAQGRTAPHHRAGTAAFPARPTGDAEADHGGLSADPGVASRTGRVLTVRYLLDTNIVSDLVRHPQGHAAARVAEYG